MIPFLLVGQDLCPAVIRQIEGISKNIEYEKIRASACNATDGGRRKHLPCKRDHGCFHGVYPPQVTLIGYRIALSSNNDR